MDIPHIMTASHSHLYRGARLIAEGLPADLRPSSQLEVLVKFADGAAAEATYSITSVGPQLVVEAYETAAGTRLDRKTWLLDHIAPDRVKVLGPAP